MSFKFWSGMGCLLALAVLETLNVGSAASSGIGVVKARGSFRVDNAVVERSGTLFEGNVIEVGSVSSEAWLNGGVRLLLDSGSRCRVYRDRLLLEKGGSQLRGSDDYAIEVRDLRVFASSPASAVQVVLNKTGRIEVAAVDGAAQVWSTRGFLVANVPAATGLGLDSHAAAAASESRLTGCLRQKSGKFIVTDETTNVTAELRGIGLDREVGNVVEVTGDMIPDVKAAPGATLVIQVSGLRQTGKKCSGLPKGAGGAAGAAAAGISKATVGAIVGGVAVAAGVSAYAINNANEGEQLPVSP